MNNWKIRIWLIFFQSPSWAVRRTSSFDPNFSLAYCWWDMSCIKFKREFVPSWLRKIPDLFFFFWVADNWKSMNINYLSLPNLSNCKKRKEERIHTILENISFMNLRTTENIKIISMSYHFPKYFNSPGLGDGSKILPVAWFNIYFQAYVHLSLLCRESLSDHSWVALKWMSAFEGNEIQWCHSIYGSGTDFFRKYLNFMLPDKKYFLGKKYLGVFLWGKLCFREFRPLLECPAGLLQWPYRKTDWL